MSNYEVLDTLLVRVEGEAFAAECHGFVCAQICVTGAADESIWKEFINAQGDDDDLIAVCYDEVEHLVAVTMEQMQSAEFGLELLLPDDDSSLALRVEALVNWCHGFLNGFGVSESLGQASITEDCNEVLEDFTQICRLGVNVDDAGDERSLLELIEYTRMGVILIFEELQAASGRTEVLH